MLWHNRDIDTVFQELRSSRKGVSEAEARKRLEEYGRNILTETKGKSIPVMFLDQFRDFMILVLIAAAVISGIVGEVSDTIAIIIIVVLNAVVGFIQEYRAEKAMAALKKMAAPSATVIREGSHGQIPADELVPGDIVVLEAGEIVPADLRLVSTAHLKIEEAALTGESVPVEKYEALLHDRDLPLGDRKNMAYKGTIVSYGRGTGIVVGTGMGTELGRIATMLQDEEETKTPLQKRLAIFGRKLALAVLALCAVIFVVGILRGEEALRMFLTAISLAVAAIPEALPAVVTISLALGAKKMVKQHALIRKLPAVETLGSVTYICSDKTGTLTMNKMTVEHYYTDGKLTALGEKKKERDKEGQKDISGKEPAHGVHRFSADNLLMMAMALSNDAATDKDGNIIGDPTETALYVAAKEAGFIKEAMKADFPRVAELPFDSERKCMTTIHEIPDNFPPVPEKVRDREAIPRYIAFTKGAVDVLIEKSESVLVSGEIMPLEKREVIGVNERMATHGQRVLGIAARFWESLPRETLPSTLESGLLFIGLVGMMDPPRDEASEAVAACVTAGIKPVMITGDHPITASAIARRIGITGSDGKTVITGRMLEKLPLEEFEERVENIRVYARVAPEQKLKIIRALQDRGQFVAMTGDGVNDAPALKRADIGISMGITGTDVAKQASHMILLDDNFATIVRSVKEGRKIFDNIRKFIRYTMTSNSGEIWTIFLAPFLGLPIPLLPIHILWINLVTDGLPGLALAAEPAEKDIMNRPPRHPQESIFAHGLGYHIIWVGFLMGFVSLFTQGWAIKTGHDNWQTMVFTVLCLSQMGHVLAIRSERESLFSTGIFTNKPLMGAFLFTFALQMATIYAPFLNPVFKTHPLSAYELLITLGLSTIVFFAVEVEKWVRRKKGW
ncbi:MAG: cation-translocating P-type ATPase [Nitrospirota bacterium]